MKKIILLLILIIPLLSGCSIIFDLTDWILPDDLDFILVIESLDTPKKISDYMREHFIYESHPYWSVSPYELWKTKKGDCNDFSTFGTFVANYHGYETYQIRVRQNDFVFHYFGVYKEGMFLSYTDCQYYFCWYRDFREIVETNYLNRFAEWVYFKVYDYENNLIYKEDK